ncbi:hypothetical protein [Tumebacillus sp. BK434]|uniref:hypothetical protein n=1 Tax=Tumebacillus sp. BK434 TaxID=2512169 RepID=UPI001052204C|nr:hypothetical protein [Tumebacillus sp. BK434]
MKLLVGTADERYNFSPEYFRSTHYPQIMHRYYQHQLIQEVTEKELFDELVQVTELGNRVYIVFGSTGAGKSELLCWLKDQWEFQKIDRPVIRISRTELNPQVLINKCFQTLGLGLEIEIDEERWNVLLKKPITIVNQIVWSTLAEFFETDEQIVPISLLMRPIIEQNIMDFAQQVRKGDVTSPLEVLSEEQFQDAVNGTTLNIEVEYELFRRSLVQKLDHFLFHGKDILSLMKQLSSLLAEKKIRPLLLIDDLVQSINLYASELLDHLITLEEGHWDVVVGLTPGALQDSAKGAALTTRIMNLDTIDDRVKKLWLSDEAGSVFYTLGKENVVSYMERYLVELKRSQGYVCSTSCKMAKECSRFLLDPAGSLPLLPFNEPFLNRLYDGIPQGKGKLRYMILHTKEMLRFFQQGNRKGMTKVNAYVQREKYADHPDQVLKLLAEWFADFESSQVVLPRALVERFGSNKEEVTIPIQNIKMQSSPLRSVKQEETREQTDIMTYLRDWIEGEKVNLELLEPVRAGIASLVQDTVKATFVSRPFTSRTTSVIQRTAIEKRLRYPIAFAPGQKKSQEIIVPRTTSVFGIAGFQQLKLQDRKDSFAELSDELSTAEWIYQGELFQRNWTKEMEQALGMSLPQFVYRFLEWVSQWGMVSNEAWAANVRSPFTVKVQEIAESMFHDWFALRENMIDADWLGRVGGNLDLEEWEQFKLQEGVFEKYSVGDEPFQVFFNALQKSVREYQRQLLPLVDEKLHEVKEMLPLLGMINADRKDKIESIIQFRESSDRLTLSLAGQVCELDDWLRFIKTMPEYQEIVSLQEMVRTEFSLWREVREQTLEFLSQCGVEMALKIPEIRDPLYLEDVQLVQGGWGRKQQELQLLNKILLRMTPDLVAALFQKDSDLLFNLSQTLTLCAFRECLIKSLEGNYVRTKDLACLVGHSVVDFQNLYLQWVQAKENRNVRNEIVKYLIRDRQWCVEGNNLDEEVLYAYLRTDRDLKEAIKDTLTKLILKGQVDVGVHHIRDAIQQISEKFPSIHEKLILTIKFDPKDRLL